MESLEECISCFGTGLIDGPLVKLCSDCGGKGVVDPDAIEPDDGPVQVVDAADGAVSLEAVQAPSEEPTEPEQLSILRRLWNWFVRLFN